MDTTYILLQQYWWLIVSLLGALLVFLMFVQGGQTLIYTLGKTEDERTLVVNTFGRKWEFTFTTLVTFGGAFFASFPLFYSTSFGGAYWVWMAILFSFVIQAVSYEYRSRANNWLGAKTFETFLIANGVLGTVLIGTAVGTFFTGSDFSVNKVNITNLGGELAISQWNNAFHGLEAALNPVNLALGLAVFFLARVLGALYVINSIDNNEIYGRARKQVLFNAIPFLVFFLFFLTVVLIKNGFAVDATTGIVSMESYKYFFNFIQMPILLVVLLIGVVGVLWGIGKSYFSEGYDKGIWFAGAGTVLTVLALLLCAGYNNTAYYPATDLQSSLTIFNSSSSKYTLTVMSYVSILVPFVLGYIFYAWGAINSRKMKLEDLKSHENHIY